MKSQLFPTQSVEDASETVKTFFSSRHNRKTRMEFVAGRVNHPLVVPPPNLNERCCNSFISAAILAHHCGIPLIISVEDVWSIIVLAVNRQSTVDGCYSFKGRKFFVDGHRKCDANSNFLTKKIPWPKLISSVHGFCTKDSETASEMSVLLSHPFNSQTFDAYVTKVDISKISTNEEVVDGRGISEVLIHGSERDWKNVLIRLDMLKKFLVNLSSYLAKTRKNVKRIYETVKCKKPIHVKWWSTVLCFEPPNDKPHVAGGWLLDFLLNGSRDLHYPAVSLISFQLGENKETYQMKICGGFLGISQNQRTKAIRPSLGWIVYRLISKDDKITAVAKSVRFDSCRSNVIDNSYVAFLESCRSLCFIDEESSDSQANITNPTDAKSLRRCTYV